jgi:hypothetical protein
MSLRRIAFLVALIAIVPMAAQTATASQSPTRPMTPTFPVPRFTHCTTAIKRWCMSDVSPTLQYAPLEQCLLDHFKQLSKACQADVKNNEIQ